MKKDVRMSDMERLGEITVGGAVASTASKWGTTGVFATTYGWLTSSGAAVLIGILVTILGFVINYLYQRKRDAREAAAILFRQELEMKEEVRRQEFHLAQLAALKAGLQTK